jgi:hypothetical protein
MSYVLKYKQASSNFKQNAGQVIFEPAWSDFELTSKVCATIHYIKIKKIEQEKRSPNVGKSSPNVFGPAG